MSKSKLLLTHTDDGIGLSREEFAEADVEEPWRYERCKGRLVLIVPADHDHHETLEPFRNFLGAYHFQHPYLVEHVFQGSWLSVDEETDRLPDIAVYLKTGEGRIPERVPELIFEIVSEGTANRKRDYEEKRAEYERLGVREYVIVDRFDHRLTVLRLKDEKYAETVIGPAGIYTTPLLPGLEISLEGIN